MGRRGVRAGRIWVRRSRESEGSPEHLYFFLGGCVIRLRVKLGKLRVTGPRCLRRTFEFFPWGQMMIASHVLGSYVRTDDLSI